MIIERNLAPYIVYGEEPVLSALEKITANQAHIVFVVSEHGHHLGALSDGDFRRWLSGQDNVDLTTPCREVANTCSLTVASTESAHEIERLFRPGIVHIPMVDEQQHITAIAINRSDQFRIGRHTVSPDHPAVLIAEIGINHQGSVEMAKHLVDLAAEAGADVVKFQLRDMSALYRQSGTATNSGEDLGPQYTLDLLAKYNLTAEQLFEVFDHCKERDIDVICTPWDEPSVAALMDYGIPALKVASADMTNHALLTKMGSYGVPLVLSTGMSTETEIKQTVDVVRDTGAPFAMLHCQSTYPAPYKDVNLAYMQRLGELSQSPVGYSGHERGFHVPVAAVALGAKVIEKHFTTDRSLEGNDHKVSLLPHEFAEMVKRVREIEEAMGSGAPRVVSTGEMMNRVNLAKSLVAKGSIEAGQVISREDIDIKSPGRGLQPNSLQQLIGRTAQRALASGDFFYASDLSDTVATGRDFTFNRPWGLPVRYHDVETLTENSTPDFLEFHFSYKDLELDPAEIFGDQKLPMTFACHSPDLFAGDFLLNLASTDDEHWERSIAELQRVIDLTNSIKPYFTSDKDPVVIASVGGFTYDAHVAPSELDAMYARVAAGLDRVDTAGVRLGCQTLPPFPWYMGGQLFCNLFVNPVDTAEFAIRHNRKLTLDISHTRLAATFLGMSFSEAIDLLAPHTEHLHLVDATGVDGEGVQVGEGDVDWALLAQQLDALAPEVSFIPEIWQGHVNNGEGFWTALERLEQWF